MAKGAQVREILQPTSHYYSTPVPHSKIYPKTNPSPIPQQNKKSIQNGMIKSIDIRFWLQVEALERGMTMRGPGSITVIGNLVLIGVKRCGSPRRVDSSGDRRASKKD